MWCIKYREPTLQEVLIMAYMNVLETLEALSLIRFHDASRIGVAYVLVLGRQARNSANNTSRIKVLKIRKSRIQIQLKLMSYQNKTPASICPC
jgi:hypothetical protein